MPALLAEEAVITDSATAYERSVALEKLWTPSATGPLLIPGLRQQLSPELVDFLTAPQVGTRAVARAAIDRVLAARAGQFGAVSAPSQRAMDNGDHDRLGQLFRELPTDRDHSGLPYFEHMLGPLRRVPPDYVLEIEAGEFNAEQVASRVPGAAGIVVVRLPQNG
ncbi:hypothetical protein [Mycobacterium intracellulare]|uniref:hypothetical protein n=1 Tax=Mycobacterium intracellulare TaxID=1767 RepID=UPI001FF9C4C9|nr:hypothetical protein [Mycobacterium intracellulare]